MGYNFCTAFSSPKNNNNFFDASWLIHASYFNLRDNINAAFTLTALKIMSLHCGIFLLLVPHFYDHLKKEMFIILTLFANDVCIARAVWNFEYRVICRKKGVPRNFFRGVRFFFDPIPPSDPLGTPMCRQICQCDSKTSVVD